MTEFYYLSKILWTIIA